MKTIEVGTNIAYIESNSSSWDDSYMRVTWFDKVASVDGDKVVTENGIKLKWDGYSLLFKGKMPKHSMVDDMVGKEMPHNLGCHYNNNPIFNMYVKIFMDEESMLNYRKRRITRHAVDLEEAKAREDFLADQKSKKDKALSELNILKEANNKVREKMFLEEKALEKELILKHCKKIKDLGEGQVYCELW